jgi:ketosteroid isomerase-like protein
MAVRRARSAQEYGDLVKQAAFEVEDLRACLEFEMEDLQRFPEFLDPLEEGIKAIYQQMLDGEYHFGREDLIFMDVALNHANDIPFMFLLKRINETHRRGIDVDGEDE